jgi:hypothetical protein
MTVSQISCLHFIPPPWEKYWIKLRPVHASGCNWHCNNDDNVEFFSVLIRARNTWCPRSQTCGSLNLKRLTLFQIRIWDPCWFGHNITAITSFTFFLVYSFIHMCIHCLGHLPPTIPPSPLTPSLPGRTCSAFFSNFVEEKI